MLLRQQVMGTQRMIPLGACSAYCRKPELRKVAPLSKFLLYVCDRTLNERTDEISEHYGILTVNLCVLADEGPEARGCGPQRVGPGAEGIEDIGAGRCGFSRCGQTVSIVGDGNLRSGDDAPTGSKTVPVIPPALT
jgi:hypothetical protein